MGAALRRLEQGSRLSIFPWSLSFPRPTALTWDGGLATLSEQLGSVVFVGDYLQLDFSDAQFTAYVWPTVTIGGTTRQFGDPGYRDALCAFITHEVTARSRASSSSS